MAKKLISSNEAVQGTVQHTHPCSDCPWRRDALNGWLGGASPWDWIATAHGDEVVPCHTISNMQCAGIAIYRRNVCKLPREPNMVLAADREQVFARPEQFIEHHTQLPGKK